MNRSQAFLPDLDACGYFRPSAELASDRPDDRTQLLAMPDVSVHNMVGHRWLRGLLESISAGLAV
jgi:hypothetical protein